jgi:hypothetical protein
MLKRFGIGTEHDYQSVEPAPHFGTSIAVVAAPRIAHALENTVLNPNATPF